MYLCEFKNHVFEIDIICKNYYFINRIFNFSYRIPNFISIKIIYILKKIKCISRKFICTGRKIICICRKSILNNFQKGFRRNFIFRCVKSKFICVNSDFLCEKSPRGWYTVAFRKNCVPVTYLLVTKHSLTKICIIISNLHV